MANRTHPPTSTSRGTSAIPGFALVLICGLTLFATRLAQAQTFSDIFDFNLQTGWYPVSGVTRDGGGNLYGTTSGDFSNPATAYELKRLHNGWTVNVLYTFAAGSLPFSGIVFGPDGALYGTTWNLNSYGNVYRLMPPSTVCKSVSCPWTETVLYDFQGGNDGSAPYYGNVIFDSAGNLYGTTSAGGGGECSGGCGTVYELSPSGSGWTEQILYRFTGGADGGSPASGVVLDQAGNLYGTTYMGGSGCSGHGCGVVYELSPSGSGWTEKVLYTFQGASDGKNPNAGVIFDQAGNLYGATFTGGSEGGGTVFELSPSGEGWSFSTLYAFQGGEYGPAGPYDNLAIDGAGSLYGTTNDDGGANTAGSVFKLTPQNGEWIYTNLFLFPTDDGAAPYGENPIGGPTVDSFGNVYGTTSQGGTQNCSFEVNCGVIWEIAP